MHEPFMRHVVGLAKANPARPFAAAIVDRRDGAILAEGCNRVSDNPIWHAEIDAIHSLPRAVWQSNHAELVMYSTAEPCPMCQSAALWAGIESVVFGISIRALLKAGWRQIEVPAAEIAGRGRGFRCSVQGAVLASECEALFREAIAPNGGANAVTISGPAPRHPLDTRSGDANRCPGCRGRVEPGMPACPNCGLRIDVEHPGGFRRDATAVTAASFRAHEPAR